MILIVGATSSIGKATLPLLKAADCRLRLASRMPEKLAEFTEDGVEIVQMDLLDEDSMRRALDGVVMVLSSVASFLGRGRYAAKHVDLAGQSKLIDLAAEAGVQHFVYISAQEATHDNPVPFFRYKARTEEHLRQSGLSYTILRPSAFFEPHLDIIGGKVLTGGKAMIMGDGNNPHNFIAQADVAQYALIALTDPRLRNQCLDIGGPDNYTSRQVAEIYAEAAGVELKVRQMPRFMLKAMATLFRPVHGGMSDLMLAILDSDSRSKAFDMQPITEQFLIQPTRLVDWVKAQV